MMFHYTSQKGFEGIVKEDGIHLWFSDARYMNDSSELISAKKLLMKAAAELLEAGSIEQYIYDKLNDFEYTYRKFSGMDIVETKGNTIRFQMQTTDYHKYVCCFSSEADSLPMWNYYLKNDCNGYAVGIDMTGIDSSDCKIIGTIKNDLDYEFNHEILSMVYDTAEKVDIFKKEILDFALNMNEHKDNPADQIVYITAFQQAFERLSEVFKDYHFAYEKEIRMMATVRKSDSYIDGKRRDDIKFRLSHGLAIPYFELLIPNKQVFKAVSISPRIGLNSDDESAIESMRVYLEHLGYTHDIEIRCSEIPLRYY